MFSSFSNSAFSMRYYKKPISINNVQIFPNPSLPYFISPLGFTELNHIETCAFSNVDFGDGVSRTGTFVAIGSSSYTISKPHYFPGKAFVPTSSTANFTSASYMYDPSTGGYLSNKSTTVSGIVYSGEYLELKMPFPFILKFTSFQGYQQLPDMFTNDSIICGSNDDGTTWTLLDRITTNQEIDLKSGATLSSNTTAYSKYRYIGISTKNFRYLVYRNIVMQGTIINAFDGLDILPRSDIAFDSTNINTSSAFITDYKFGVEEYTKVSGEFKVSCSSAHNNYRAGYAFKSTLDTWAIADSAYSTDPETNYLYDGSNSTSASGITYNGEWLQIECPMEFNLKYFSYSHHKSITGIWMRKVVVVGSNDGNVWNYLTTVDAPTLAETNTKSQLYGNTTAYKFYRYIVTNAGGTYGNPYLSLITMKTYIPIGYNTTFSLPVLSPGLPDFFTNIEQTEEQLIENIEQTIEVEGWTFPTPTPNGLVLRFNNLELSNYYSFYTYEGLTQQYVVCFIIGGPHELKIISQNTPFTTGTYTVGLKVTTTKGYSEAHKIYVKIGGIDAFPDGIGFTGIGEEPTTQPWINPKNNSFVIQHEGDRTMEIWSVSTETDWITSGLFVAELVVYKN